MPTGYLIVEQSKIHYLTFQIVYWIDVFSQESGEITEVARNFVSANEPSKLSFVVRAGRVACLSITTQFSASNKLLNEPRTCTFDYMLAVV